MLAAVPGIAACDRLTGVKPEGHPCQAYPTVYESTFFVSRSRGAVDSIRVRPLVFAHKCGTLYQPPATPKPDTVYTPSVVGSGGAL